MFRNIQQQHRSSQQHSIASHFFFSSVFSLFIFTVAAFMKMLGDWRGRSIERENCCNFPFIAFVYFEKNEKLNAFYFRATTFFLQFFFILLACFFDNHVIQCAIWMRKILFTSASFRFLFFYYFNNLHICI